MSTVALSEVIVIAAILAGTGVFLLTLGALGLLQVALARLVLSLSPPAAQDQRLQTALGRYHSPRGAQPRKGRPR